MSSQAGNEELVFHQRIRLPYRYTAGQAQRAFLRGLAERRLVGSRCERCAVTLAPARPFCPRCSSRTGELVELAETGVLEGFTRRGTAEQPIAGVPGGAAPPEIQATGDDSARVERVFGMVRLDGADTAMLHLVDAPAESLQVGTRVRARWSEEPGAEITAIEAFVPDEGR